MKRIVNVSRHSGRTWVEIKTFPSWLQRLFGKKEKTSLYWTEDDIYWYTSGGKEVCVLNDHRLFRYVREHDARVKLFGNTLA